MGVIRFPLSPLKVSSDCGGKGEGLDHAQQFLTGGQLPGQASREPEHNSPREPGRPALTLSSLHYCMGLLENIFIEYIH